MIQKAAAMGNWWLTASSRQCVHSASHLVQSSLVKHQITQVTQPLQPRFDALWLWAFPKTKITFEREEISNHWRDSGKHNRAADGNWESCVKSQGDYFEGDWGIIILCTMFLVSSSVNVSIFHSMWLDTFRICIKVEYWFYNLRQDLISPILWSHWLLRCLCSVLGWQLKCFRKWFKFGIWRPGFKFCPLKLFILSDLQFPFSYL